MVPRRTTALGRLPGGTLCSRFMASHDRRAAMSGTNPSHHVVPASARSRRRDLAGPDPDAHPHEQTGWVSRLRRVQRGGPLDTEAALDEVLRNLLPVLERYARWSLHPRAAADAVDDVVQRTAIRISRGIARCRADTEHQFLSWVLTVAKHVIHDFRQAERREEVFRHPSDDFDQAAGQRAFDAWHHQWDEQLDDAERLLIEATALACAAMPTDAVELIWHHVIEDASWEEAAKRLGTTAAGAKRRFQRAQRTLRRLILRWAKELPPEQHALLCSAVLRRLHGPAALRLEPRAR